MTVDQTMAARFAAGLREVREGPLDDRQLAARRVGETMRAVIDRLTATGAPAEVLNDVAARMSDALELLGDHPSTRSYQGIAEASGLGRDIAFFDWSPQLGLSNPLAPPIYADVDVEKQIVVGRVRFGAAYEGPPGCVHGGFIAAAFDEVLGLAQSLSGQVGMTGTLTIKYRKPTPLHTELRFEGRLDSISGRKVQASADLYAGDVLTAEATGLFIAISSEHFNALSENRSRLAAAQDGEAGAG